MNLISRYIQIALPTLLFLITAALYIKGPVHAFAFLVILSIFLLCCFLLLTLMLLVQFLICK